MAKKIHEGDVFFASSDKIELNKDNQLSMRISLCCL